MTPDQLRHAARNLAYGLGMPFYIRDGRIYQDGPGLAFLPPNGDPAAAFTVYEPEPYQPW